MADFLKAGKADELSPGQARRVRARGKRLALFNIDGNCYGLEDTCTHKDGPLSVRTIAGDLRVEVAHVQLLAREFDDAGRAIRAEEQEISTIHS